MFSLVLHNAQYFIPAVSNLLSCSLGKDQCSQSYSNVCIAILIKCCRKHVYHNLTYLIYNFIEVN